MTKLLSDLIGALDNVQVTYADGTSLDGLERSVEVSSLVFDSREVTAGALFFALPGTHTDGNKFIGDAIKAGAVAVVYQGSMPSAISGASGVCFIRVADTRQSMAPIAARFYDEPSVHMVVIGVTGTEGKSSTVSFIWQLLRAMGRKAGFVSTVEYSTGDDAVPNPEHQTTPESPIVQMRLHQMLAAGCEYAVLEASSHALSKRTSRLAGVHFDCAVFMNVTEEHLEFHGTFEQYRDDKANLFRALDASEHTKVIGGRKRLVPCLGVVNADDKSADYFVHATGHKVLLFGTGGGDIAARNVVSDADGIAFDMVCSKHNAHDAAEEIHCTAALPGAFNALNLMAAVLAVCGVTGAEREAAAALFPRLTPIKGRMTRVDMGQPFEVIIDYAHTPSSFNMIFPPIRERCKGRMIALFGSGGERDRVKRPVQGEVAAKYCDLIVLTDEDPRGEDAMEILREIAAGAVRAGGTIGQDVLLIPRRPLAIREAFKAARAGDIVLLLGKGHENSIIGKDGAAPYDEETEARTALKELHYGASV